MKIKINFIFKIFVSYTKYSKHPHSRQFEPMNIKQNYKPQKFLLGVRDRFKNGHQFFGWKKSRPRTIRAVMWTIALKSQGGALVSQAVTSQRGGSSVPGGEADGAAGARAGAAGTAGEISPGGGEVSWAIAR